MIRAKIDHDSVKYLMKILEQEVLYKFFIKYEYRGYETGKDFQNFLGRLLEGNLPKSLSDKELKIIEHWRKVMGELCV